MTRRFKINVMFMLAMLALIAIPMTITYTTSYKIDELQRQQHIIDAGINAERNAIRVLQAEWAYLTKPARIEKLAAKHLHMEKAGVTQLARARDLDAPVMVAAAEPVAPVAVAHAAIAKAAKPVVLAKTVVTPRAHAASTPEGVKLLLASFQQ